MVRLTVARVVPIASSADMKAINQANSIKVISSVGHDPVSSFEI